MKNQKIVIIGSVLTLAALAMFLIKKKMSGSKTEGVADGGVLSGSLGNNSVIRPGAMVVKMIMKDGGKGTSNIMLEGNQPISSGQSVEVNTPELKGTYVVWHVYHGKSGAQPVTNLHLTNAAYKASTPNITTSGYAVKV